MKKILIWVIRLYQKLPISTHGLCRFQPTCSEYAIECIDTYGVIYGLFLSIKRILRCNPWSHEYGFDPVSKKEK